VLERLPGIPLCNPRGELSCTHRSLPPERWQLVDQLYNAALEDRAVLDTADPELRREVESLLAHDGPALDRPAWEGAAALLEDTQTQLTLGAQLGRYQIEATLGADGMGEVYRAVDTRLAGKVAIKVSAKQFSERFEREARAISALNHPVHGEFVLMQQLVFGISRGNVSANHNVSARRLSIPESRSAFLPSAPHDSGTRCNSF
jgi:hypothetical protein